MSRKTQPKIGIVGFTNIKYMPYLRYYTEVFDLQGVEYELIYWDRRGLDEAIECKAHVLKMLIGDSSPKLLKVIPMLHYAKFVRRTILQQRYRFLIFLTPIPAVLLSRFLIVRYSKHYVVDIRDYTMEHNPIYFATLRNVLKHAALRVISSPAFKNFLPVGDYTLCHNLSIPKNSIRPIPLSRNRGSMPIRVSYIGAISYFEEVIKFIHCIANDDRFAFSLYGSGMDERRLEEYCKINSITNVNFYGPYDPSDLLGIFDETDVIFNAYGNTAIYLTHALSNKLYNAAWYQLPILVSPHTEMESATGYLGFAVNYTEGAVADAIYKWYKQLDWNQINTVSTALLDNAIADNSAFKINLMKTINQEGGQ